MTHTLFAQALIFNILCEGGIGLSKIAYIRKLPNGYWGVFSEKGKSLGKYKTKVDAEERLKTVEMFKHMKKKKKASLNEDISYSSTVRNLNKSNPDEVERFRKIFKKEFDKALIDNEEEPEQIAIEKALQFIDLNKLSYLTEGLAKLGAAELGNPKDVGIYLASLIKFILRKISDKNRNKSIKNLKNKIYLLNEYELAGKKLPPAASIGQSLVIIKHLLFGKDPAYIRAVLNSIAAHL